MGLEFLGWSFHGRGMVVTDMNPGRLFHDGMSCQNTPHHDRRLSTWLNLIVTSALTTTVPRTSKVFGFISSLCTVSWSIRSSPGWDNLGRMLQPPRRVPQCRSAQLAITDSIEHPAYQLFALASQEALFSALDYSSLRILTTFLCWAVHSD